MLEFHKLLPVSATKDALCNQFQFSMALLGAAFRDPPREARTSQNVSGLLPMFLLPLTMLAEIITKQFLGTKGRAENNKLNFMWPKMARLGPRFFTPKIPRKCLYRSVFCFFLPGNEAHKLFSGGQHEGFCLVAPCG